MMPSQPRPPRPERYQYGPDDPDYEHDLAEYQRVWEDYEEACDREEHRRREERDW